MPFKSIFPVPGSAELVERLTATYQLESPDTLTTEKVFYNTHRMVAVDQTATLYTDAAQRYVTGSRRQELFDLLQPQLQWLQALYPSARPFIVQVATIPPGKELLWHIDSYIYQSLSHKVHIPVITNEHAFYEFMIGKKPFRQNFKVGTAYEINNILMHRSSNSGTHPRTHVIVDMLEEEGYELLAQGVDIVFTYQADNKRREVEYWK